MDIELRERSINGLLDPIQSLTLRSMFWGPHFLDDSAWLEYIPFSYWLIEALEPESIVEVGAPELVSYFSMCHAVVRLDLGARCEVVYPPGNGAAGDGVQLERLREWNNVQFHAISRIVQARFDDYVAGMTDGSVDLLHIDLCREEEWTAASLDRLLAKVSGRGVCLVHGARLYRDSNACNKWVAEQARRYPSFEFTHGEGMTLLAVGAAVPDLAKALCSMAGTGRARQAVRDVFSRLGRACLDMQTALKLKQVNQQLMASAAPAWQAPAPERGALVLSDSADENVAALARANKEIAYLTDMLLNRSMPLGVGEAAPAAVAPAAITHRAGAVDVRLAEERAQEAAERERAMADELERVRKLAESYRTEAKRAYEHRQQHERELAKLSELVLEKERIIEQQSQRQQTQDARPPSRVRRLTRWMRFGSRRKPTRLDREIELLLSSDLFDAAWYAGQYMGGADSPAQAARHFLTDGGQKGYHPSRRFDTPYYLQKNPDVIRSGINPLVHYLKFGVRENRKVKAVSSSRAATGES